eukprot:2356770-Pyramimonas_sp.AAC.1
MKVLSVRSQALPFKAGRTLFLVHITQPPNRPPGGSGPPPSRPNVTCRSPPPDNPRNSQLNDNDMC